jgi:tetratricopeptide (TPR) repeat protein
VEREPSERPVPDVWIDEGPVRDVAEGAVARGHVEPGRTANVAPRLPDEVLAELERAGGAKKVEKLAERLDAGRGAFERERYLDARRILSKLARDAPGAASVRELYGLTLYRLERWKQAAGELEAYRALARSPDQDPVLADCYRALHRYSRVEELWEELRAASPSAALVTEGRIVTAGARADQGDLEGAIALLARTAPKPRRVREHHLRQWYALADLYDRSGDVPQARRLFREVIANQPGFADAEDRLAALR